MRPFALRPAPRPPETQGFAWWDLLYTARADRIGSPDSLGRAFRCFGSMAPRAALRSYDQGPGISPPLRLTKPLIDNRFLQRTDFPPLIGRDLRVIYRELRLHNIPPA